MGTELAAEDLVHAITDLAGVTDTELDVPALLYSLTAIAVDRLDVHSAGVLVCDEDGRTATAATCGRDERHVPLFTHDIDQGPGAECWRRGTSVSSLDLTHEGGRWPTFTPAAIALGFRSVHALPMTSRGHTLGSLTLVQTEPGAFPDPTLTLARSFAQFAGLNVLLDRNERSHAVVREQLQGALDSRVIVEQAKGYLARIYGESPSDAFTRLRGYTRARGLHLVAVAADVVSGTLDLDRPRD